MRHVLAMKLLQLIRLSGYRQTHTPMREKLLSSLSACIAIVLLLTVVNFVAAKSALSLLVLASMGASAFLLFVVPHSPMAQPWPLAGGHLLASFIGIACAQLIPHPVLATGAAMALSIYAMHALHCPHPPSAATAMIAVLGGPEVQALGWSFCYEVVALNAALMLLLGFGLNALIPGRRYPLRHTHHPHHEEFARSRHARFAELRDEDLEWALGRMEGVIDVTREDLMDIYEFAMEHARERRGQ